MKLKFFSCSFSGIFIALFIGIVLAFSSQFTYGQTSTGYQSAQVPVVAQTGLVLQVRDVNLEASPNVKTVGSALGGVIGAMLGAKANAHQNIYLLTGALGAMGATGGAILASSFAVVPAQEIIVILDDKRLVAVAQSISDGERFQRGQRVFYLNGRIAPMY